MTLPYNCAFCYCTFTTTAKKRFINDSCDVAKLHVCSLTCSKANISLGLVFGLNIANSYKHRTDTTPTACIYYSDRFNAHSLCSKWHQTVKQHNHHRIYKGCGEWKREHFTRSQFSLCRLQRSSAISLLCNSKQPSSTRCTLLLIAQFNKASNYSWSSKATTTFANLSLSISIFPSLSSLVTDDIRKLKLIPAIAPPRPPSICVSNRQYHKNDPLNAASLKRKNNLRKKELEYNTMVRTLKERNRSIPYSQQCYLNDHGRLVASAPDPAVYPVPLEAL